MKKVFLPLFAAALIFTACKKDSASSATSSGIEGTWNLTGISESAQSTSTVVNGTDVLKGVSISSYTSANSSGTMNFGSNNQVTITNVAYAGNFVSHIYSYDNGVLTDSTTFPSTFNVANYSAVTSYQVIGTDSIYFPSGFVNIGGTTTATQPGGGKFAISGNTLTLNLDFTKDSTFQGGGIVSSGTTVATLSK